MYYINPWVFYIIGLITHIQITCVFILIVGGVIWGTGLLIGPAIIDEITKTQEKEKEESYLKIFWKWMKRFPLIFLICLGVTVVIPSEATIYKMMIASKISADDVDHVVERLDEVVDAIIESRERVDDSAS